MIAAGAILLFFGGWAIAYKLGFGRADERASREISRTTSAPLADPLVSLPTGSPPSQQTPERISQPLSQPAAAQPSTSRQQSSPPATATRIPPPVPAPASASGVRPILSPPEPDPRQAGLNYLAIEGQLDRESAVLIVTFLAEQGFPAVAVDTAGRGSNNHRAYRVYGLRGFSSAEYRLPARTEYEQEVSRLGTIFRRDHRGWTDFAQPYWERYQP